ncbi:hypothetical protein AGMMS49921_11620 [Endomicrobiia bacterium]|nr:hypothetical protein AGMMS49921_11620 [Endomicrobiia bacterium]
MCDKCWCYYNLISHSYLRQSHSYQNEDIKRDRNIKSVSTHLKKVDKKTLKGSKLGVHIRPIKVKLFTTIVNND